MQLVFLTTVVEPSLSFVGYGTRLLKSEQASDSSWNSAGLINLLYIRYYNDFFSRPTGQAWRTDVKCHVIPLIKPGVNGRRKRIFK